MVIKILSIIYFSTAGSMVSIYYTNAINDSEYSSLKELIDEEYGGHGRKLLKEILIKAFKWPFFVWKYFYERFFS